MVSEDEFVRSLDVTSLPPVIGNAVLRLARNCFRDRDDWEVAVQKEDFTKVFTSRDFDSLYEVLAADILMWLRAPQRSPAIAPPFEFVLCRNPVDPIGHLTRARAIRAPYG